MVSCVTVNSAVNFVVYCVVSGQLRADLVNVMRVLCCTATSPTPTPSGVTSEVPRFPLKLASFTHRGRRRRRRRDTVDGVGSKTYSYSQRLRQQVGAADELRCDSATLTPQLLSCNSLNAVSADSDASGSVSHAVTEL